MLLDVNPAEPKWIEYKWSHLNDVFQIRQCNILPLNGPFNKHGKHGDHKTLPLGIPMKISKVRMMWNQDQINLRCADAAGDHPGLHHLPRSSVHPQRDEVVRLQHELCLQGNFRSINDIYSFQFSDFFFYFSQFSKMLPFIHAMMNPMIYWLVYGHCTIRSPLFL